MIILKKQNHGRQAFRKWGGSFKSAWNCEGFPELESNDKEAIPHWYKSGNNVSVNDESYSANYRKLVDSYQNTKIYWMWVSICLNDMRRNNLYRGHLNKNSREEQIWSLRFDCAIM